MTNLACTVGSSLLAHVAKHRTVYERFFYRAVWSLEDVSRRLLIHMVAPVVKAHATEAVIDLAIDGEGDQDGLCQWSMVKLLDLRFEVTGFSTDNGAGSGQRRRRCTVPRNASWPG